MSVELRFGTYIYIYIYIEPFTQSIGMQQEKKKIDLLTKWSSAGRVKDAWKEMRDSEMQKEMIFPTLNRMALDGWC